MMDELSHIGIGVFDLEKSVRFYTEVIGMEIEYRAYHEGERISQVVNVNNARLKVAMMRKGSARLELIEYVDRSKKAISVADQAAPGLLHLAFTVPEVDTAFKKLQGRGYSFNSPPMVTRERGPKICYFLGPDNVTMELCQEPGNSTKALP